MERNFSSLVQAVKDYANTLEHYEAGWDVIAECYDDAEIAEVIGLAVTIEEALAKFAGTVEVVNERRSEIVNAGDPYDYSQDLVDDVAAPVLVIEADQAVSAEVLREDGYYVPAEKTTTGPACGNCAKRARALGNKEAQRHATADLVRYCYEYDAMEKDRSAQQAAELHAEMLVERHFEERGAYGPDEDMYSWVASL